MKRIAAVSAVLILVISLTACNEKNDVAIDAASEKYVGQELPVTLYSLEKTLAEQGKIPEKIRYFGDEYCGDETLKKLKEECAFEEDSKVVECIGYEVDYHYSKNPFVVLRSIFGGKYTEKREDVQYWFVREDGGEWVCVNDEKVILG